MKKPRPAPPAEPVFAIDGAPVAARWEAPIVTEAKALLAALPFGQLLTSTSLAEKLKRSGSHFKNAATTADWQGMRVKDAQRMLYGHPKTIIAYTKARQL